MLAQIADYLAANGVGTVGVDIFAGQLPDDPDACVALFATPGGPPGLTDAIDLRAFQARSRAVAYTDAEATIETVFDLMHGLHEQQLDGVRFVLVKAKQAPFSLGRDLKQRHELACNFSVLWDNPAR